jgi:hypothetical protein
MSDKNDDIFEKEDKKEYIKDDITLTETKETVTKRKRQPREQKKANKLQPKEEVKAEVKAEVKPEVKVEVKKEVVKQKEEVDPEYLEWKKQKQVKKEEVKVEIVKQEVKVEPVKIPEPVKPYIVVSNFKKPMWSR